MRGSFINIAGEKFGKLTVKERYPENGAGRKVQWICMCDCGSEKVIRSDSLRNGITTSCGCENPFTLTHGMSFSPEYKIWDQMRQRCHNPKNKKYHLYGGRGITVCNEWKESFEAFYRDMGPRPSTDHSIDRRDNNKGYSKENCRWVTQKEQNNNKDNNLNFTYHGKTQNLMQWSQELGFNYHNVKYRIHNGMLFEVAIQIDQLTSHSPFNLKGETKTFHEWCRASYTSFPIFRHRLYLGWTIEEALSSIDDKLVEFEEDEMSISQVCGLLDLPLHTTCLRILRGELFEDIIQEQDDVHFH